MNHQDRILKSIFESSYGLQLAELNIRFSRHDLEADRRTVILYFSTDESEQIDSRYFQLRLNRCLNCFMEYVGEADEMQSNTYVLSLDLGQDEYKEAFHLATDAVIITASYAEINFTEGWHE